MNSSEFDIELFIQSFKEAGATVIKQPELGKLVVNEKEETGLSVLKRFFNKDSKTAGMSMLIEGKELDKRTDFPDEKSVLLAA